MNNTKLLSEKKEIDNLIIAVENFSGDDYIKSLLTFYLCIRISGFIENCIRIIYTDYSLPKTKGHVSTFVDNKLKKFPNPTWDAILALAKEYNPSWKANLKNIVSPKSQLLTSLESINNNRNNIAHGGSSSITLSELKTYYSDVVLLLENIEITVK